MVLGIRNPFGGQTTPTMPQKMLSADTIMDSLTIVLDAAMSGNFKAGSQFGRTAAKQLLFNTLNAAKQNPDAVKNIAEQVSQNPGSATKYMAQGGNGISLSPQYMTGTAQFQGSQIKPTQEQLQTQSQQNPSGLPYDTSRYKSPESQTRNIGPGGESPTPIDLGTQIGASQLGGGGPVPVPTNVGNLRQFGPMQPGVGLQNQRVSLDDVNRFFGGR